MRWRSIAAKVYFNFLFLDLPKLPSVRCSCAGWFTRTRSHRTRKKTDTRSARFSAIQYLSLQWHTILHISYALFSPLRQKFLATIDLSVPFFSLSLSLSLIRGYGEKVEETGLRDGVEEIERCRQTVEEMKKEDAHVIRANGRALSLSTTRTKRNVQTKLHSFARAEWQPRAEEC